MFRPPLRLSATLTLAACMLLASGCTSWKMPSYDLNKLRDPRASDIDKRMSEAPPVFDNAFR